MSDLILIVDDEEELRDVVHALLELKGFTVIEASNVKEMYFQLANHNVSLILLDIGLPEIDGLTTLKELRPENDIPIVLLTGKEDINYKVVGLELGADDYITKPFHSHELVARIKNILRRTNANKSVNNATDYEQEVVSFDGWKLNINSQVLINPNDIEIMITSHEFAILHTLIKASGRTLSREQLLDNVSAGSRDYMPYDRSLDVMIAKLRKKLGDSAKMPRIIRTIRQAGYMFIAKIN